MVKATQTIGQKICKERSNSHDRFILRYLLVSKDSPKNLGLYLIHKSHNVKLKLYLELS